MIELEDFRRALEETTGKDLDFFPISRRAAAATAPEFDEVGSTRTEAFTGGDRR